MKKYLAKGSIKPWKAFLFFQVLGLFVLVMFLTLMSVAAPKFVLWLLVVGIAIPYVIFTGVVFWANTGNPKVSVTSALAKLWCIIYFLYGVGVVVRLGLNA